MTTSQTILSGNQISIPRSSIETFSMYQSGYFRIVGEAQNAETTITNYGEGAYNSQYYGGETQTGIIGITGTNIMIVATISAVILFCSLLAIIARRPSKTKK